MQPKIRELSFQIRLIFVKMVDRSCDVCHAAYTNKPDLGFFSVTQTIRGHLGVHEELGIEYICNKHFKTTSFDEQGRLLPV